MNKQLPIIKVFRENKTENSTTGRMWLGDTDFCYSLEDITRPYGEKVKGKTAIPAGTYNWKVTWSNRFKRNMILIYNQNDLSLKANGISFKGIRIHGGNTHKNTEGCILVAYKKLNDDTIQGTAEKAVTGWAHKVGGSGIIVIEDRF